MVTLRTTRPTGGLLLYTLYTIPVCKGRVHCWLDGLPPMLVSMSWGITGEDLLAPDHQRLLIVLVFRNLLKQVRVILENSPPMKYSLMDYANSEDMFDLLMEFSHQITPKALYNAIDNCLLEQCSTVCVSKLVSKGDFSYDILNIAIDHTNARFRTSMYSTRHQITGILQRAIRSVFSEHQ